MAKPLSRRGFLAQSAFVGCSLAASPLMTPISMAAAPGDNRLVVIILRGGMDGIDVLRPWGDRLFRPLRTKLAETQKPELGLGSFYGAHPELKPLLPLWQKGELAFVQATSTPYRNKRSHFDGQDILEAGTAGLNGRSGHSGWLNRLLPHLPGAEARTAFALGREQMLVLAGDAPISNWSPDVDMALSSQGLRLLELTMQSDPRMAAAMAQAVQLAGSDGDPVALGDTSDDAMMASMMADMQAVQTGKANVKIAAFAAAQLRADARIVSFSLNGWDTHANQHRTLKQPLRRLSETLLELRDSLGADVWQKTTVLCMTEFGRTVRENGNKGTDHGTGGTMLLAGGALRGGRVYGTWPGLAEADLYNRRDLMPTSDIRAWAAWAMRGSFGVSKSALESEIFPGLDMRDAKGVLL